MSGRAQPPQFIHISRLQDAHGMAGWQVRMPRWHPQSNLTRYFPDSGHGGKDGALLAARSLRDQLFADAKLPLQLKGDVSNKRNTSGLVGVMLADDPRREGVRRYSWVAYWTEGLEQKKRSFSVLRYGLFGAMTLAIEVRDEMTEMKFSSTQISAARAHLRESLPPSVLRWRAGGS